MNNGVQLIVSIAVLLFLFEQSRQYFQRNGRVNRRNASLLLTHYTDGAKLMNLDKGDLARGASYNVIATNTGSIMYIIQLPFFSTARITAIPTAAGVPQLKPGGLSNVLKPVVLEGDYPKYFSIYASQEQKSNVQYILDPAAMQFTLDFCRTHSWELIDDQLLIISSPEADEVLSLRIVERLIAEIQPRVAQEVGHITNRHKMSYGSLKFMKSHCPVCDASLERSDFWFSCPNGHGYLLTGKVLSRLRHGEIDPPISPHKASTHQINDGRQLQCPACQKPMKEVNYLQQGIVVDSCTNCHFRWLDAGEPQQVHTKKT